MNLLFVLSLLAALLPQADRMNYYSVTGATAAAIRANMNQVRPPGPDGVRLDAFTTWTVHWTYRFAPSAAGCSVTSFDATLTTAMTLPRWANQSTAPGELQRQWGAYYTALLQHERGHIRIGELAQGAIREAGRRITTSNCSEMNAAISRKWQELLAQYKAQEAQYDKDTNHGMKQGAKFP